MTNSRRILTPTFALLVLGSPGFLQAGGKPGKLAMAAAALVAEVMAPACASARELELSAFPPLPELKIEPWEAMVRPCHPSALPGCQGPLGLGVHADLRPFYQALRTKSLEFTERVEKGKASRTEERPADEEKFIDWLVDRVIHHAEQWTLWTLARTQPDEVDPPTLAEAQAFTEVFGKNLTVLDDLLSDHETWVLYRGMELENARIVLTILETTQSLLQRARPLYLDRYEAQIAQAEASLEGYRKRLPLLKAAKERILAVRRELRRALPNAVEVPPDADTYRFPDHEDRRESADVLARTAPAGERSRAAGR